MKFIGVSRCPRSCLFGGSAVTGTKVGMITTLSGGGAGLGIDVRDGFMLAIKQSGL